MINTTNFLLWFIIYFTLINVKQTLLHCWWCVLRFHSECPGEKGRPCDGNIVAKQGRFGAFSGCTNFPTCRVHWKHHRPASTLPSSSSSPSSMDLPTTTSANTSMYYTFHNSFLSLSLSLSLFFLHFHFLILYVLFSLFLSSSFSLSVCMYVCLKSDRILHLRSISFISVYKWRKRATYPKRPITITTETSPGTFLFKEYYDCSKRSSQRCGAKKNYHSSCSHASRSWNHWRTYVQ
jgi:hypothetical protein